MIWLFVLAIGIMILFALWRGHCPSCRKLRAAKFERSSHEGGFFFGQSYTHHTCKYCGHKWQLEDNSV